MEIKLHTKRVINNSLEQIFFRHATFAASCHTVLKIPVRPMLQCQLHEFLAERNQSLHDFSLEVGIHYNKLHKLYYQKAIRVDLELVSVLCRHLKCGVGDLFIVLPKGARPKLPAEARLKRGRSGGQSGRK